MLIPPPPPAGGVVWFLDSLIPSAADQFYFCESTCPEAGRYAKTVSFPSQAAFFTSTVLFAWLLIKGELEMISCSEVLRIIRLRKTPHVYSREHPAPARTGCTQSARLLDFAASSPASPGMREADVLRRTRRETCGFRFYSTVFNLKSCIFTWLVSRFIQDFFGKDFSDCCWELDKTSKSACFLVSP